LQTNLIHLAQALNSCVLMELGLKLCLLLHDRQGVSPVGYG